MHVLLALAASLALAACNPPRTARPCRGSTPACLTKPECAWDQARGCDVCHCSDPSLGPLPPPK